jgi:hypothetical protein
MINAYDGPKTEPWFDDFGDLEPLEKELEAAWEDFIAAVVGTKEEDVAREAMSIARANLAAHVEGREPVRQFVDEFGDLEDVVLAKEPHIVFPRTVSEGIPKQEGGVKFDGDKPRYDLEQVLATEEVMKVLTYGANKYSADNWRLVPDFEKRYYSASRRHIASYMRGELIDPESGLSHLAHAITCLSYILEIQLENKQSQE